MKLLIKRACEIFCLMLLSPALVMVIVEKRLFPTSEFFYCLFSQFMSLMPGMVGSYLRRVFYWVALESCGKDFIIEFGSFFSHRNASVGNNVYIGSGCILGQVDIKDDVLIASKVSIPSGRHQHHMDEDNGASRKVYFDRLSIGKGSWIGEGAMILASVGEMCVVGSGSVLVKPIESNVTAVGNPAKEISRH